MTLTREEADRRNRECKKRYYEKNRDLILEKAKATRESNPAYNAARRQKYKDKLQELIDEGVYQPAKRGRKSLYHTREEALEVKHEQMKVCRARRAERIAEAEALLLQKKLASVDV